MCSVSIELGWRRLTQLTAVMMSRCIEGKPIDSLNTAMALRAACSGLQIKRIKTNQNKKQMGKYQ